MLFRGNEMIRKIVNVITMNDAPPARRIAYSFFIVIFIGAFLLWLPISNQNNQSLSMLDALFTATSATCVTGLSTVVVMDQFTRFGQIVLICLMQIGGIGLMTLVASFLLVLRTRLSMNDKIAIKELLNQTNIMNFKTFLQGILKYTFVLECVGAVLLMYVFIPEFGVGDGIFNSIFLSISAFCNAGFDNLSNVSLVPYASNMLVCIVVMFLITMGGLGFVVWFDVQDKWKLFWKKEIDFRHFITSLTLHTKLVLITSFLLIIIPSILFFVCEYTNPLTLGSLTFTEKIVNAFFTSITLRTAGFASLPMPEYHLSSHLLMMICMFIGGSPGGTAGGIKTTTLAVIIICVIRSLRGKKRTNIFNRHISRDIIVRATTIMSINLVVLFTGLFILTMSESFSFIELAFEAVSALATVGLSLGITPMLSVVGKWTIILLMFVGRIGIMTFIMSFVKEDNSSDIIHYAEGHVIVG